MVEEFSTDQRRVLPRHNSGNVSSFQPDALFVRAVIRYLPRPKDARQDFANRAAGDWLWSTLGIASLRAEMSLGAMRQDQFVGIQFLRDQPMTQVLRLIPFVR